MIRICKALLDRVQTDLRDKGMGIMRADELLYE